MPQTPLFLLRQLVGHIKVRFWLRQAPWCPVLATRWLTTCLPHLVWEYACPERGCSLHTPVLLFQRVLL